MALLLVLLVFRGCDEASVPKELRTPELPSVSVAVEGKTIVLSARFASREDMAAAVVFGFYFGDDKTSLERLLVTKTTDLTYSLIEENLGYSKTY